MEITSFESQHLYGKLLSIKSRIQYQKIEKKTYSLIYSPSKGTTIFTLIKIPILEWYVDRCGSKNGHQNDTCS